MSTPTPKDTVVTVLTDLGLGQNEANLYEILIGTPDATIPALQKKSPFSRTMLYYILQSLEQYELVETKQAGPAKSGGAKKTVYNAVAPERLENFIAEQEKTLRRQREQLQGIIGDLRSTYNLAHNKPGVRFFEGPEGIREVTFDSLNATGTIYTVLDVEAAQKYASQMNEEYVTERIKRGIIKKQICLDTPFTRERYKTLPPPNRLLEIRLLPLNLNPFKTGLQIYNHTISYSTLTDEKQIGVIIVDENIANMHRSLFEYMWNTLPPLQGAIAASPPSAS